MINTMKKNSIIALLFITLGFGIGTTSCSDMLDATSDRYVYEAANDTLYNYWGIISSLQKLGERYVILGECRGDLFGEGPNVKDSIKGIMHFGLGSYQGTDKDKENVFLNVSDYYAVINGCNCYLASADTMRITDAQRSYFLREYAQVEVIRAWTYLQLVANYGKVPYYTQALDTQEKFENLNMSNYIDADNIAEKLAPSLKHAYAVQQNTLNDGGYPQYGTYGSSSTINSQKTMFQADLVLGDIYLLNNRYAEAAQQYYNYLSDINYGGVLPTNYTCTAYKPIDQQSYIANRSQGCPWTETGAWSASEESITCIFSVKNKEYGHVSTGLNEVLGFYPIQTNDQKEPFTLDPQIKRLQIIPSTAYMTLAGNQKYEVYDKSLYSTGTTVDEMKPSVYEGVGDAREAWTSTLQWKEDLEFGNNRWIFKQNPSSKGSKNHSGLQLANYSISMVYPMIYRKSQVWLRFAEAINRAGYPGYAFAVLKNGLCYDRDMGYWLPRYDSKIVDYNAARYQIYMTDENKTQTYPSEEKLPKYLLNNPTGTDSTYILSDFKSSELYDELLTDVAAEGVDPNTLVLSIKGYGKCPYPDQTDNAPVICNYISMRETQKANHASFLNGFQNNAILLGSASLTVDVTDNRSTGTVTTTDSYDYTGGQGTYGIHSHGCGRLKYDERHSVYNYPDQINIKYAENGKLAVLTNEEYNLLSNGDKYVLLHDGVYEVVKKGETVKTGIMYSYVPLSEIYDDANLSDVEEAIEDLIVDEEALELAFEGHRYFDLLRVARHRGNDVNYFQKHINARDKNSVDIKFSTFNNIYLPLPDDYNKTGKIYK